MEQLHSDAVVLDVLPLNNLTSERLLVSEIRHILVALTVRIIVRGTTVNLSEKTTNSAINKLWSKGIKINVDRSLSCLCYISTNS